MSYPNASQREFLDECGLAGDRSVETMHQLQRDLERVNEDLNLTRITDAGEFWTLHVADSLSVGRVCGELLTDSLTVADVGCGGGFPIFPLAWANPSLRITGIESRYRKAEFLKAEADALGLANVEAIHQQAREAGQKPPHRQAYDRVLLRAVGTAGKMVRQVRGLLKPTPASAIIFYKTPEAIDEEKPIALREADKYGFELDVSQPFSLPEDAGQRQFLILRRTD
ncbi:MAG: 16S rRNA (guanine(527)-N(7))-methyltransferase RsmG [Planctomycetota bacterium]